MGFSGQGGFPVPSLSAEKPLVYLVDDDPIVGRLVRKTLESEGFRVQEFLRGLRFLKELPRQMPDLILLDLRMPSLSGEVILELLRELPLPAPLRILLYSSVAAHELAQMAERYQTNGYVSKSTSADDLLEAVRSVLAQAPTFFPVPPAPALAAKEA